MKTVIRLLSKTGILQSDIDYHLIRASMVLIFLSFGYQKWFEYEAQVLIPYISNGPLIFWLYPAFGVRGASWFLGVSEWLIGALLLLGFWDKRLGILGAIGSTFTFVATVTIIPFMPNGWDPAAGFPAMAGNVPFLMKDVVLLAASIYLLKQDLVRVYASAKRGAQAQFLRACRRRSPTTTILPVATRGSSSKSCLNGGGIASAVPILEERVLLQELNTGSATNSALPSVWSLLLPSVGRRFDPGPHYQLF
jgi:uncharacterized membrane protein YkgB